MATKTIESMYFYVPITGYKDGIHEFSSLRVSVRYCKGRGFRASFTPGWVDSFGWGCVIDGSNNPLTAGMTVDVEQATKNSSKRIAEMHASLELAKDIIAALFDDREWEKLKNVMQNAARFGYTERFREQGEAYLKARKAKSETINNNSSNQNETVMAENVKAADLIGKVIVVGENQGTITIIGVQDNGNLQAEFRKTGEDKTTPMAVTLKNLQAMQERGLWRVQSEELRVKSEESAMPPAAAEVKTEADVDEVQDIVPVVTPRKSEEGRVKSEESAAATKPAEIPAEEKPTAEVVDIKPEKSKPKSEKPNGAKGTGTSAPPKPKVQATGKLTYETYTSSKGKQCARILGFKTDDAAYQNATELHGSASWNTTKDGRVLYVAFGPKYAAAAKQVCDALNAGKSFEDCKAIVEGKGAKGTVPAGPSGEKTYTAADVAEMLRKVMAGGDVPEDIKALLKAA